MSTPRLRVGPILPTDEDLDAARASIAAHVRNHGRTATAEWLVREISHALLCITSPGGAAGSTVRRALALRQAAAELTGGGRS